MNSAVSISSIAGQVGAAGDTVSLQVTASDAHSGATLTYSAVGLPEGLSINSSTGLVSGTLAAGVTYGSADGVAITVTDGTSSDMAGLTWTIGPLVEPGTFYTEENTGCRPPLASCISGSTVLDWSNRQV